MTRNNDLLMLALSRFFSDKAHVDKLMDVLQGKNTVSLRLLDYFVTNYARKHKTTIAITGGNATVICVHSHYRSQLKAFSKQRFDPFKRRERIIFELNSDNSIETTVGQLNFFRWSIETGVLQYVMDHRCDIEKDMCSASTQRMSPCTDQPVHVVKNNDSENDVHVTGNTECRGKHSQCVTNQLHVTLFKIPQMVMFD